MVLAEIAERLSPGRVQGQNPLILKGIREVFQFDHDGKTLQLPALDGSRLMVSLGSLKASIGGAIRGPNGGWLIGFSSDDVMLINSLQNGLAAVGTVEEVRMIHSYCSEKWQLKFRHI